MVYIKRGYGRVIENNKNEESKKKVKDLIGNSKIEEANKKVHELERNCESFRTLWLQEKESGEKSRNDYKEHKNSCEKYDRLVERVLILLEQK